MGRSTVSTPTRLSALADAYDLHGGAVYGLALRLVGDPDVAETLTEGAFATLRPETLDPARVRECLLIQVHRDAMKLLRERDTAPDPATFTGVTWVDCAGLPSGERSVITAAYGDGLTYHQIATRLGLEAAAVAAMMRNGLQRLAVGV